MLRLLSKTFCEVKLFSKDVGSSSIIDNKQNKINLKNGPDMTRPQTKVFIKCIQQLVYIVTLMYTPIQYILCSKNIQEIQEKQ